MVGVFALDLLTSSDWIIPILYLLPLWIASRALPPRGLVLFAGISIVLLIADDRLASTDYQRQPALLSRIVAAGVIGVVTVIVLPLRRDSELLREANEQRARDLAEREQTAKLLCASEARYRLIVDHAHDTIYRIDRSGLFTFVNPSATRLTKYSERELIGRHYLELIRPDYREAAERVYVRQCAKKIPNTYYEFPVVTKDGEELWVGQNVQSLMEGDEVVGFQAVVRDMTEQKQTERERQELAALIERSNDFIGVVTPNGRVSFINEAGRRLVGLKRLEDVRRTAVSDYVLPQHQPFVREQVLPLVIREGRWDGEIPFRHRQTGEAVPAYWNVFLMTDRETKEPTALAWVSSDLTHRKRAEAALREREVELRALLDERERLSEDLHDNIVQMLYATGMQLEECKRLVNNDVAEVERRLDAAIRSLNAVIRDVRGYIIGDEPTGVSAESFLAALKDLAGMIAAPYALNFRLQADPVAAFQLTREQAQHVLYIAREAVSNTLRHARARNASLALEAIEEGVRLQVEDDGDGFDVGKAVESGRGLINMRLRAAKLGATLEVAARRGSGTRIMLLIRREPEDDNA